MARGDFRPIEGHTMYKGVQLPYTVRWVNGRPDPKTIDPHKVLQCMQRKLCGVCGRKLRHQQPVAFVGGRVERLLTARPGKVAFNDPAMHLECAVAAIAQCPFLHKQRVRPHHRDQAANDPHAEHDSGHYGIVLGDKYDWRVHQGTPVAWPVGNLRMYHPLDGWPDDDKEVTTT